MGRGVGPVEIVCNGYVKVRWHSVLSISSIDGSIATDGMLFSDWSRGVVVGPS